MKPIHSLVATLVVIYLSGSALAQAKPRTPVLVELFTSEGCSSCPPADALLAKLQLQQPIPTADIIVLEEHVDYWESLGWHDRFSSHQFTDRQSTYGQHLNLDDNYTPQMIVDGTDQFVGNDSTHALRAITQAAARSTKLPLALSALTLDGNRISGSISSTSTAKLPKAGLYAALVQPMASTQVGGGENSGRTLHHVSVVRKLVSIGSLDTLPSKPLAFSLQLPTSTPAPTLQVVVFAQQVGQGAILAATLSTPIEIPQSKNPVKPQSPLTSYKQGR